MNIVVAEIHKKIHFGTFSLLLTLFEGSGNKSAISEHIT